MGKICQRAVAIPVTSSSIYKECGVAIFTWMHTLLEYKINMWVKFPLFPPIIFTVPQYPRGYGERLVSVFSSVQIRSAALKLYEVNMKQTTIVKVLVICMLIGATFIIGCIDTSEATVNKVNYKYIGRVQTNEGVGDLIRVYDDELDVTLYIVMSYKGAGIAAIPNSQLD